MEPNVSLHAGGQALLVKFTVSIGRRDNAHPGRGQPAAGPELTLFGAAIFEGVKVARGKVRSFEVLGATGAASPPADRALPCTGGSLDRFGCVGVMKYTQWGVLCHCAARVWVA